MSYSEAARESHTRLDTPETRVCALYVLTGDSTITVPKKNYADSLLNHDASIHLCNIYSLALNFNMQVIKARGPE